MVLRGSFLLLALCAPAMALAGQTSSGYTPGMPAKANPPSGNSLGSTSAPNSKAGPPSTTLQPSLRVLHTALSQISIDKWKASQAIRDEADSNLRSVQRDLQSTLPPLLAAADAAPDSMAKSLPVFRNIDALYDVMLRLDAAGRLAAPKEQISALDQALATVGDARSALGDQVQASADGQEARMVRLQAALKAVPPPAPPPAPAACTPPPTKKKSTKPAAKAAAKPATPANSQSSPTPSH